MKSLAALFVLTILVFSSCNDPDLWISELENSHYIVKDSEALYAANSFSQYLSSDSPLDFNNALARQSSRGIKSAYVFPDENNEPAYYIVNFDPEGFVIISGDKRINPIQAYSPSSEFSIDTIPTGVQEWMFSKRQLITAIRSTDTFDLPSTENQWDFLIPVPDDGGGDTGGDGGSTGGGSDDGGCSTKYKQYGPLMTTRWNQGCGYNDLLNTCTTGGSCGRVWTGCVATAMSQILRYHQFPNNYNWANMANVVFNAGGSPDVAVLMRDAGNFVSMDYGCDGSGANVKNEVPSAFRDNFGYSSATYSDFSFSTALNEIKYDRPVILTGGENTGWWIFGQYSNGHAWVADGYLIVTFCSGNSSTYLHMNYGWGGQWNGFYEGWTPGNWDFTYKKGMVYNIRP